MLLSEIDQRLLFPGLKAGNWEEALDRITEKMIEYGYVYPSFQEAVKQREREYPTGLTVRGDSELPFLTPIRNTSSALSHRSHP